MKAKVLIPGVIIAILAVVIVACKKDQYTTNPQLSIKSIDKTVAPSRDSILFTLNFTDKEGDIKDTVFLQKKSKSCSDPGYDDPIRYPMPDDIQETRNMKGEIEIKLVPLPICADAPNRPDTCVFRFWMHDRAGNVSDTVVTPTIVILPN